MAHDHQEVYDGPWAAAHSDRRGLAQLVAQVWVETLRNPRLAALLHEGDAGVEAAWERLVQAYQNAGRIPQDIDGPQVSHTLVVVLRGFIMQQAMFGDFDVDDLIAGMRGLPGLFAYDEQSAPAT